MADYTPSIFGANLRRVRRARDLTQAQLSAAAGGVSVAAVETGKTQIPQQSAMLALAGALGVTLGSLWQEPADPPPTDGEGAT